MAEDVQIKDAWRAAFGREPSGAEIEAARPLSMGQLNDRANLERIAGGGSSSNYIDDAIARMQKANEPIVASLQASVPEIKKSYADTRQVLERSKEPLLSRYENLISSITNAQTTATNQQTLATSNELARRGISSSSGYSEQEMMRAVEPVREKYATLVKDAGISREEALLSLDKEIAGLTNLEVADVRSILTTIAQLQAGAVTQGVSTGLSQTQIANQQKQFEMSHALQKELADLEASLKQAGYDLDLRKYEEVTKPLADQQLTKSQFKAAVGGWEWV